MLDRIQDLQGLLLAGLPEARGVPPGGEAASQQSALSPSCRYGLHPALTESFLAPSPGCSGWGMRSPGAGGGGGREGALEFCCLHLTLSSSIYQTWCLGPVTCALLSSSAKMA